MFDREWALYSTVSLIISYFDPTNGVLKTLIFPPSYLIAANVVYLTIAEKSYPRKLAFSYLDELSKEFQITYGPKVETARKPYAFVGFGGSLSGRRDIIEVGHPC